MIPIALDPASAVSALAGNGTLAVRRLRALRAGGAERVLVYAPEAVSELVAEAGDALIRALPDAAALDNLHALWIADLPEDETVALAAAARRRKVLVNVEDRPELCDFHSVAELRRGDLLLTISTGGAAPGLAGVIRRRLEAMFGAEWSGRVAEVAALRRVWRGEGVAMPEAARRIAAMAETGCWFPLAH